MKRRSILAFSALCATLAAVAALAGFTLYPSPTQGPTIFDPDPNHIWNRTYSCLFIRQDRSGAQFGADAPDPLLWAETHHLLTGDSHRKALACLDEFLAAHAERTIREPLKRAVFQHDLWAIFDWADMEGADDFPAERKQLESRLAEVIQRLALTPDEVRALPDTYAAAVAAQRFPAAYDPQHTDRAFLPPDLFQTGGPWVPLSGYLDEPTAIVHFTGRSRFLAFIRLPAGRAATLDYMRELRRSGLQPHVKKGNIELLNLALLQIPVGTQVALVRQEILLDTDGNLVPTSLTETVQFRAYHAITLGRGSEYTNYINGPSSHDQDFFEFRLSRPELFAAHGGGLVPIQPQDTEYATFATHGMDEFEGQPQGFAVGPGRILLRCTGCHSDSGIHSIQSRMQWMKPPQGPRPAADDEATRSAITWETNVTIAQKKQQADFKLLQEFWRHSSN